MQLDFDKEVSEIQTVRKYRVLLVNDEAFLLFAYKLQLESHFEVELAENGLKAVQKVCSQPRDYYDAVILDINMPIMNGLEASSLIYNYLNEIDINLHNADMTLQEKMQLRVSKTLIYCLSADYSPETI